MSTKPRLIPWSDTIHDLLTYQAALEGRPIGDVVRSALIRYLDAAGTAKHRAAGRANPELDETTFLDE